MLVPERVSMDVYGVVFFFPVVCEKELQSHLRRTSKKT